jgi:hypothetical protein
MIAELWNWELRPPLFSAALEASALTLGPEQKAKKKTIQIP